MFLEHQRFLLRVTARRLGGSQELAEDACAFAWLQLLRCQPDREAAVGWLRVVARNEGLRLLRISGREPFLEGRPCRRSDPASGEPLDWQELLPGPVDTQLAVEARELLRALAGLRWHQRTVLTLQLAGYSYKEIAQRLGKTYSWGQPPPDRGTPGAQARRRPTRVQRWRRRYARPPDSQARRLRVSVAHGECRSVRGAGAGTARRAWLEGNDVGVLMLIVSRRSRHCFGSPDWVELAPEAPALELARICRGA